MAVTNPTRLIDGNDHRMIIDCHGHYTTAPKALQVYRDAQIAALADPARPRTKAAVSHQRR